MMWDAKASSPPPGAEPLFTLGDQCFSYENADIASLRGPHGIPVGSAVSYVVRGQRVEPRPGCRVDVPTASLSGAAQFPCTGARDGGSSSTPGGSKFDGRMRHVRVHEVTRARPAPRTKAHLL